MSHKTVDGEIEGYLLSVTRDPDRPGTYGIRSGYSRGNFCCQRRLGEFGPCYDLPHSCLGASPVRKTQSVVIKRMNCLQLP